MGILYKNQLKYELAEKYYLEAIIKGNSKALNNLGVLYDDQQKYELAEYYYLEAIEKGNLKAVYNLALLYDNHKQFKLAEKYYLEVIEKGEIDALSNLALLFEKQQKYDLAEKYYLIAIEKGIIQVYNKLALIYYKRNINQEKALELINKLIENSEDPSNIVLQIIVSVWSGIFIGINAKVLSILTKANSESKEFLLTNLLIHHQKSIVLSLFEDEKLKEQFIPLYYATLLLENEGKDENVLLKIPSEILSTVQDIVASIKEKQEFYYPAE